MADLAAAQTRLAQSLAPMASQNAAFNGEPHISARTARLVIAGQIYVAHITQQLMGPEARLAEHHRRLESRSQLLVDVDRRIAYLVDEDPSLRTAGTLSYWQQSEITSSLQRLTRHNEIRRLTTAEAETLEAASRSACHNFGAALRRELVREDSNLRIADPTQQVGAARVTRRSPLGRALTELVNDSRPEGPPTPSVDVQRAVLRQAVDTTPTTRQPTPRAALAPTR